MARSPAEQRLLRILSHEEYGPKLARLTGDDERYVLRLIDQNKGKDARRAITRLDEERRARERAKRNAKRSTSQGPTIRGPTRGEKERQAVANILKSTGGKANRKRVRQNVSFMDDEELDFAIQADFMGLARRAKLPPDRENARGDDLNPFWYH